MSYIGKKYVPSTNVGSVNINNGVPHFLAGNDSEWIPQETIIVSEPYYHEVSVLSGHVPTSKKVRYVNVKFQGEVVRVQFYEFNVNANLTRRRNYHEKALDLERYWKEQKQIK